MTVTGKLLRVYHVDCQLTGLRSRLTGAEKFLAEQERQLKELSEARSKLVQDIKRRKAQVADRENEAAVIEGRIETSRERMNSANNNKEYKALLLEVNELKEAKSQQEGETLGLMEELEKLQAQETEIVAKCEEREKMRGVAKASRDEKEEEIRDRLEELSGKRGELAGDVPGDVMAAYTQLFEQRGSEAMAPLQELDRKRHEFSCGSCMMAVPLDLLSSLMSHGNLTRCVSCGVILYVEDALAEAMTPKKR